VRTHRVVGAVGPTVPLVLRNPVVVPLDLVRHVRHQLALRQLDPPRVVPVVHHRNRDARGVPHPHARLRLVRALRTPHRHDARKGLVGK
jgi:hypothetical protein